VGEILTYRIIVTNTSSATQTNVRVEDMIPFLGLYTHLVPGSIAPAQQSGPNPIVWVFPVLPPGGVASMAFGLSLTIDPLGRESFVSNIASVSSDQVASITSNPTNNPVLPPGVNVKMVCAASINDVNRVTWRTGEDQVGLSGFRVHRALSPDAEVYDLVTLNPLLIGTSSFYTYTDTTAPQGVTYYYWIEAIARNNLTYFFGPAMKDGSCYGKTNTKSVYLPLIVSQQPVQPLQSIPAAGEQGPSVTRVNDPLPVAGTIIAGIVFQDYNSDGRLAPILPGLGAYGGPAVDTGLGGVTVTVYDAAGAIAGTAVSNPAGLYTITGLTSGAPYRVQFATIPGFEPSAHGTGPLSVTSGTSVQFVTAGSLNVSFGLLERCAYCQDIPSVAMPSYVNGPFSETSVYASDVLVRFPYSSGSYYPSGSNTPPVESVGLGGQVGATWGVAYHPTNRKIFSAAFAKRFAAYGPGGPGAIYVMDPHAATPNGSLFFDVTTLLGPDAAGENTHPSGAPNPYLDAPTFQVVGKVGLGDIEISEDGKTLYTVNLFSRTLLMMNVGDPPTAPTALAAPGVVPGPAQMGAFPIPSPCSNAATDARPFGLGRYLGKIYIGGVCTGESNPLAAAAAVTESINFSNTLSMYVYEFDPLTGLFSASPVLQRSLDYPRRCAIDADNDGICEFDATWRPWRATFPTFSWNTNSTTSTTGIRNATPVFIGEISYPQPWLSDIEFTRGGDMLLGLRDRFPDQHGYSSPEPLQLNAPITYYLYAGAKSTQVPRIVVQQGREVLYSADGAGDLLRACRIGSAWVFESNASCGGRTTGGASNGEGPAGGSYFYRDGFLPDAINPVHDEVALGGLAMAAGFPDMVATTYNPYQAWSSGVRWFSDLEGFETKAFQVFGTQPQGTDPVGETFGKGNGLGDIALMCDAPPIEIGNRVWLDQNGNGAQDAGEPPIAGVLISLYDAQGRLVATTTTSANGTYYFSSAGPDGIPFTADDIAAAGPDKTPNTADDIAIPGLKPSTLGVTNAYTVAIARASDFLAGGPLAGLFPTSALSGSSLTDSDGIWLQPTLVSSVLITVGGPGQNNHSIDFGFAPTPPLTITKSNEDNLPTGQPPAVANGSTITYTLRITNTGQMTVPAVRVTDTVPLGTVYVPGSASPAAESELNPIIWAAGDMAPGAVFVAQFSVIVQPTSADTITNTGFVNGLESNQVINVKAPTAIGLATFGVDRTAGGVRVRWRTSQENNTLGFRLYRASSAIRQGATLATSGLIAATGATTGADYAWLDAAAPAAGAVYYWLEEVDMSGAVTEYGPAVTGASSGLSGARRQIAR
jgi:uncharacterized repeat protein (TIGR01451 family)